MGSGKGTVCPCVRNGAQTSEREIENVVDWPLGILTGHWNCFDLNMRQYKRNNWSTNMDNYSEWDSTHSFLC